MKVTSGKGKQTQMLKGGGYLSASELVLTFGLGDESKASTVEVVWPSGQTDRLTNVDADQMILVVEGKGQVGARKFGRRS